MQRAIFAVLLVLFSAAHPLAGADEPRLLPIVASGISGVGGSGWDSEVEFYNRSDLPQAVSIHQIYPLLGGACVMSFVIPPREGSSGLPCPILGPPQPWAAAIEIIANEAVVVRHRIVSDARAAGSVRYAEFSQTIPVEPTAEAYSRERIVHNLRPRATLRGAAVRHNLGLVNPNAEAVQIRAELAPPVGAAVASVQMEFTVPPKSVWQFIDFLAPHDAALAGVFANWTLAVEADLPFYAYISRVDNSTHDAEFLASVAGR